MPDELTIDATWGREPLPAAGDGQLSYLVVDLTPSGAGTVKTETLPLNLALVLDHSGSMAGAKIVSLKEAVNHVIDQLSDKDTISITIFDERAKLLVPATQVQDKNALKETVSTLREAGGTHMSSGLRAGLDEARKGVANGVISRILLLTDGQTWGDTEDCETLAAEAGTAGIPISAFGVGGEEDWSAQLLDNIAEKSGGQADYIARPSDISLSFGQTVQQMQETVIRNARVTLQLAQGVILRQAYRITPMIGRVKTQTDTAATASVPVGEIVRGQPATLLFELVVPPRKPGQYRLVRIATTYQVAGAETGEQASKDMLMTFAGGVANSPGNPRVMNMVEKATAFKLQTRALEEAEVGNLVAATRTLRSAATRLLNLGEVDLAQEAENEAQRIEANGQMSSPGTKKLTFATRKLGGDDLAEATGAAPVVQTLGGQVDNTAVESTGTSSGAPVLATTDAAVAVTGGEVPGEPITETAVPTPGSVDSSGQMAGSEEVAAVDTPRV